MKARDLMVPLQEYLTSEMTLCQASRMLRNARRGEETVGVKGLPVLEEGGKMVGFLSMGDILAAVLPTYMNLLNLGDFSWEGMVDKFARKAGRKTVAEMMATKVVTVYADQPLMTCVDHMLKNGVKRLPVLEADGRVVGILYERDVFLSITEAMLTGEAEGCP